MSIKAGQLIHVANQILVDRAQNAGPGTVNINRTKVYELGNYKAVGSVTDLPDLTFTLESFDASAEFEATLLGRKFGATHDTQTVTVTGTPTGGDFTLTFNDGTTSATTGPIAFDATAATAQTTLEALANIDPGEVTVTGAAGGPYTVVFSGDLAQSDVKTLTANAAGLTGGTSPGVTVTTADSMADGTALALANSVPIDVASQFKAGATASNKFDTVGSVAVPYLTLESMSYRFGLADNASQTATLRGDGLYYTPGSVFIHEVAGSNTTNQVIALPHDVYPYKGDTVAGTKHALSVSLSTGERLSLGADYTENAVAAGPDTSTVSVTVKAAVPTSTTIRISYASDTVAVYPQLSHAIASAVRPAAIRGRNITVAVAGTTLNDRWTSVQSVQLDYRVQLQRDEEFGSSQIIGQDYDVPDVTGNIVLKPRNYAELYNKVRTISGVSANEVVGALTTEPLPLYIELHSPDSGAVLKSFYIPDARFNLPGFSGRVQQKLEVTFDWTSETGDCTVYKGPRP